jgi:hypothetical protein
MVCILVCSVNFKMCQNSNELVKWTYSKENNLKKNRNNRDLGEYFLMYIMKKWITCNIYNNTPKNKIKK